MDEARITALFVKSKTGFDCRFCECEKDYKYNLLIAKSEGE